MANVRGNDHEKKDCSGYRRQRNEYEVGQGTSADRRHISEGKGDVHAERAQIFLYVKYVGIRQR